MRDRLPKATDLLPGCWRNWAVSGNVFSFDAGAGVPVPLDVRLGQRFLVFSIAYILLFVKCGLSGSDGKLPALGLAQTSDGSHMISC
ncbi:MAG: hypothetical protein KME26_07440 [Oscillatoria princeps RMCB-10]|nr:hypothetical protein [Oscillatoria princeps RMCB-10]